MVEFNQGWAKHAPVLAISVAQIKNKEGKPNTLAFHDVGSASAQLTFQAVADGLYVHQMAGFDANKAREVFHIPEDWQAVATIAIGYPGDPNSLPDKLKERELAPRVRKALADFVMTGDWGHTSSFVRSSLSERSSLSRRTQPVCSTYNGQRSSETSGGLSHLYLRTGTDKGAPAQTMHGTLEFLLHHGYVVLLAWVFLEQIGLPVPSIPILFAAGALAGTHHMNLLAALVTAVFACAVADTIWFQLGRIKGIKILQLLCKISLEPDSCVRRTEGIFAKEGSRSLLLAKFLPGLGTVAPPLAGIFHMRLSRFLLFDCAGAALWAASFLGLGFVFSNQIEKIADHVAVLGGWLLVIASRVSQRISGTNTSRGKDSSANCASRASPSKS